VIRGWCRSARPDLDQLLLIKLLLIKLLLIKLLLIRAEAIFTGAWTARVSAEPWSSAAPGRRSRRSAVGPG
jgi:hypothetical protein